MPAVPAKRTQDISTITYPLLPKMEEDRAQADLGEAVDAEIGSEKREKQKQPRKRFIGRKEAAERGEKSGDTNGTIEDSGNIQSTQRGRTSSSKMLTFLSCATKKDGQSAQPGSFRDPQRSRNQ